MKRWPLRFTIRSLQIAVLGVALVSTFSLYIDPRAYWRELVAFLFCPLMCLLVLLCVIGTGSGRRFGLGFLFGFVLEHVSMAYCVGHGLVRYSTTTLAPLGWYPLQIPLERMILRRGWADLESASVPATFVALLVSGMVCGGIAFATGESLKAAVNQRLGGSGTERIGSGFEISFELRSPSPRPRMRNDR
jgi:hypothetical protein